MMGFAGSFLNGNPVLGFIYISKSILSENPKSI